MPICHNITSDGDDNDYHYADGDGDGYHYADGYDGYADGGHPLAAAVPVGGGVSRRGGGIR